MTVDERAFRELIVESQDLQVDALRDMRSVSADLADVRADRRREGVDPDEIRQFNDGRRSLLRNGGFGLGAFAARGAIGGLFASALAGIVASPAGAQGAEDVDVMVLQTAASLENLAVATYGAALDLAFVKDGNATVKAFAETTMGQHKEHGEAFNAAAKGLGGKEQTEPNAKYLKVVQDATPGLTDYTAVIDLATALEQVATQTYVSNLALIKDTTVKKLMASVMGVEAQHLAVLRAAGALVAGGAPQLITVKDTDGATDLAALPAAAGSVSFPESFEGRDNASPPEEGAVK